MAMPASAVHGPRLGWRWWLLLAVATAMHLAFLGQRSMHHDEAVHAKLAYDLVQGRGYRYDPTYHGPLLYYLDAAAYVLLPVNDTTARLPVALAGIALVLFARRLRWRVGEGAAVWSGVLLALSPTLLFFGRFLRMDVLEALAVWGVMLALERLVRTSGEGWIELGIWLGLAVATKENCYVSAFVLALSVLFVGVTEALADGAREACSTPPSAATLTGRMRTTAVATTVALRRRAVALFDWTRRRWAGLVSAVAAATLVLVPAYTVGLEHPQDWLFPVKAITFWWGQHSLERIGGPWWYYLPRLAQYEFLIFGAAFAWVLRRRSKMTRFERLLAAFGVLSVGSYCYLGEKVPWLGVHQIWPFVPLAGAQLAHTWGRSGRWFGRGVTVIAISATIATSIAANFLLHEMSPARERVESLHFVQTTPEFAAVAREGVQVARSSAGCELAASGEADWPLSWYWRDLAVAWSIPEQWSRPALVVVDPAEASKVMQRLPGGYTKEIVPLRAWWLMERSRPTLHGVADYLLSRRPWSPIGRTDVAVLRRLDGAADQTRREVGGATVFGSALGPSRVATLATGWLAGPRGVAGRGRRLAVADTETSRIVMVDTEHGDTWFASIESLNKPEDVAWTDDDTLVIADTWNHRVLCVNLSDGRQQRLQPPRGGWYGPRSVAVSAGGKIAVADTGNKRLVWYEGPDDHPRVICAPPSGVGLVEPGGIEWLEEHRLLVCDTGNRRVLVVDTDCRLLREIGMPDAWEKRSSRPQIAAIGHGRWIVSDSPGARLWLISSQEVRMIDLTGADLVPTGVEWSQPLRSLFVADLNGRVWMVELPAS